MMRLGTSVLINAVVMSRAPAGSKGAKCRKGERRPAAQPESEGRDKCGNVGAGRNRSGVFLRDFGAEE
jgi:hypothetical protein